MNFDPEVTIASKLPKYKDPEGREPVLADGTPNPDFAGVAFTIHQFTEGKRLKIRLALADSNTRIRELVSEKLDAEEQQPDENKLRTASVYRRIIDDLKEVLDDKISPTWVRHLLLSVRGLTIKGQPATADSLIESGPRDLYQEIVLAIRKEAGILEQERGESDLATTSSVPADGQMSNTGAPAVVE